MVSEILSQTHILTILLTLPGETAHWPPHLRIRMGMDLYPIYYPPQHADAWL